jgi:DNA-binding IclR family transcriptional regulator
MPRSSLVSSIDRILAVLSVLAEGGTYSLTEITRLTGLNKSSAFRILSALKGSGMAQQEQGDSTYSLGPKLLEVSLRYLSRLDLRNLALPELRWLKDTTGQTATLSLRIGYRRVYLDQVESESEVKQTITIGSTQPLYRGASGKAILAAMPEQDIDKVLAQAQELDEAARLRLRAELALVRERGFAISRGERVPGAAAAAAPILNHRQEVVGAVSVATLSEASSDADLMRYGALARETAQRISRKLGHLPGGGSTRP